MLSITVKKGQTAKDLLSVADYPDEKRNRENQVGAVEDYYSQGCEATPSQWMGSAAEVLGLSGQVDREDHLLTLQGFDPRSGEALVQKAGENRRYAFDLTFSAPKSVSIAWAVADKPVKKGIEAAQDRAVEVTLAFIEENFALGRRGSAKDGTITKECVKLLAAAYRHGSSRELDPQIHTHLVTNNLGVRPDWTWGALNEKELFEWKLALGAIYRSELAAELQKNLGFVIESDRDYFRLTGIPKELEEEFSKRRAQIEAALRDKGHSGGKAAEVAALDTRKGKKITAAEILREEWTRISAEYGVNAALIQSLRNLGRDVNHDSFPLDRKDIFQTLTAMEAVFRERDIYRVVAIRCSQAAQGLERVKANVAEILRSPEIVKLRGQDKEIYFTTRRMLSLEREILALAKGGKNDRSHILASEFVQAAMARFEFEKGFSLSEEQRAAIVFLTTQSGRIAILEGHAGAGKSTVLIPVRTALEASGFEVIGTSLQGKKAAGLEQETGIKSQTIASLLRDLRGYETYDGTKVPPARDLTERSVVVVDEAAMNDTRLMADLVRETERVGAKLLLVGDESQLPPVAAGNPFKTLKNELGFATLMENRRQRQEWQKEASREIRVGEIKEALQKYLDAGMIMIARDREEAIRETVAGAMERFNPEQPGRVLLTAYKRTDVRDLNELARETMIARNLLSGPRVEMTVLGRNGHSEGTREFQAGDRIYFRKNSKGLGVMNGESGTLIMIDVTPNGRKCAFTVRMDKGAEVRFDPRNYSQIDYGYAVTVHKSQGMTVDFSSNLVTGMGLNALYVQLTRHRDRTRIVLTEDQMDRVIRTEGVELAPTEKMVAFVEQLVSHRPELTPRLPKDWNRDFDLCRDFLDVYSGIELGPRKDLEGLDCRLEKVRSLLSSIRKNEKMNAMDFEIVEEKERKVERMVEKELKKEVKGREIPEKEMSRTKEDLRLKEQEIERLEMEFER